MPPPGSWFYKLRRKPGGDAGEVPRGDRAPAVVTTPSSSSASSRGVPVPPPCTPNRASYYVPSGERGAVKGIPIPPKRRDTQLPRSPQPSDIVFDVVTVPRAAADRFDGLGAMPELKLRPILTKPAGRKVDGEEEGASGSGSASPTARARRRRRPRIHVKPSGGRKGGRPADAQPPATATAKPRRRQARRGRWLQESLVVVKESADPEEDFLASMAEMIAANDEVRASPRGLEELLACYLALNAAEHHRAIVAAFRRAWLDDAPTSTAKHRPPPSQGLAS
ncbi:hypothetical protein CFC21_015407 [Triticum aestivum]|uniref:Transcription repressor n=3 Tax=Triticum TaxID=4564 RepID=A0A9R1NK75_TRITD|nr:transcription repressor OFP1-like [Triticum aestivum]KAF6999368.1 hypothetical protein CFC21_015407 [Triticum aestivum]VAH26439.1 unnamed protein product [Triticum turgidum subsp. durum]